ncbi:MAG: acetyl-CoA carboxylase biotin carboxylase subunit [SAR324 cluster bacterium]|nr:acetyl-CoA carboxylase biotin carboxylase subunit [SAR324 cluster bacterium]
MSNLFHKILIANRGEIACRVIRTAHRMGIICVAVYSDADEYAQHVQMADEAYCLGEAPVKDSYLKVNKILEIAGKAGVEAIHPGYGFLAENPQFAETCAKKGFVFIGPPAAAIAAMGSKNAAKTIMEQASVPLVPGYHGEQQNPAVLQEAADAIGYPVLLKPTAGGGGKGMRIVSDAAEFKETLVSAQREARSSFGDDRMLLEKYLTQIRHVEIQIFADTHQNAVYLFERDCSLQRRHQKIIEEAPAPGISAELRKSMGQAAIQAAHAIGYVGAGTVEFLLTPEQDYYFMEMNTRLQVEHPVTEMITGEDLVEWQLRVASGEALPKTQEALQLSGHALEARIYAEEPEHDFLPATGVLQFVELPKVNDHVRIDTGVVQNDEVSVYYDPMISKLIVWDTNRHNALRRLKQALTDYRILGVKTNIEFLKKIIVSPPFQQGLIDTRFVETHHDLLFEKAEENWEKALVMAALTAVFQRKQAAVFQASGSPDPYSPWHQLNGWRMMEPHLQTVLLVYKEEHIEVFVEEIHAQYFLVAFAEHSFEARGHLKDNTLSLTIDDHNFQSTVVKIKKTLTVFLESSAIEFILIDPDLAESEEEEQEGSLTAPMNGTIVTILAEVETPVEKGEGLLVIEAMKMEHTIRAACDGRVKEFYFFPGDLVPEGTELLNFEPSET